MHFKAILASIFLIILSSSFAVKKSFATFAKGKMVGVYDRDSLLNDLPAYRTEMESIAEQKRQFDSQHVAMYVHLAEFRSNFYRDSATMTPVIKAIKLQQIDDIRINIAQYAFYSNEEINSRVNANYQRFNDLMKSAAAVVSEKKGLDTVLDKKELIEYKKTNSPVKTKNVTNDMRVQLGINK